MKEKIKKIARKIKKNSKVLLSILAIVTTTGIAIVNAATPDNIPPVLKSISLNSVKSSYKSGDKVKFNIDASDAISDIEFIDINICLYDENNDYPCKVDSSESLEVYDLNNNPYIILPDSVVKGTYVVESLWLCDTRSNCSSYDLYDYSDEEEYFFVLDDIITFEISSDKEYTESYKLDKSSIKSVTLNKTSMKPGEKIKITGVVTDENVDYMEVDFYNEKGNVWIYGRLELESSKDGEYEFVGYIECPYKNGNYKLNAVSIMMYKENGENASGVWLGYEKFSYNIKVTGNKTSIPNFKLKKIIYDKKTIIAPSIYKLSLQIEDKNSLVNEAEVLLKNKNDKKEYLKETLKLDENGYLTGYFDIDQYTSFGQYYIEDIDFGMRSSDGKWKYSDVYNILNDSIQVPKTTLFEVIDSDFYDVVSSTTDKDLIEKINEADNSAKIGINAMNNSILKKEVFEAIKDTNKTIYIETNGIQWVFNGKNVKSPKDIDTKVTIKRIENDSLKEKIGKYLDKGIVINFKNNGTLPGTALVKIKTDYVLRDYIGTSNLQVYHYNKKDNKMFDEVANDISITKDYDLQFYISHNSSFIISNKKVDDTLISNDKKELSINKEIQKSSENKNNDEKSIDKKSNLTYYIAYSLAGLSLVGLIVCWIYVKFLDTFFGKTSYSYLNLFQFLYW